MGDVGASLQGAGSSISDGDDGAGAGAGPGAGAGASAYGVGGAGASAAGTSVSSVKAAIAAVGAVTVGCAALSWPSSAAVPRFSARIAAIVDRRSTSSLKNVFLCTNRARRGGMAADSFALANEKAQGPASGTGLSPAAGGF